MGNWKIPLADIDFDEAEIEAVTRVLRSRWLSMGPVTAEFEARFAEYIGVKYAFAVTNCTVALHLAHLALGAGPGDTVLCPSLTFVATANAIRYTGASPRFVDVTDLHNWNISPKDIEAKIDETTKGICVMHYGGYPCAMESILQIARQHNLYVVEDAAHAPGAACWLTDKTLNQQKGYGEKVLKKCGSIGDIGCFSFFSNKNMSTGEGGMLTTNNETLAEKIQLLRSHGMTSLTWDRERGHSFSYDVLASGYNYRIDELRSALGCVQLQKLDTNNQRRMEIVNLYREKCQTIEQLSFPFVHHDAVSSGHLFPILLSPGADRHHFMQFMKQKGIQTSIHYPPIHTFSYYRSCAQSCTLPLTEELASRIVTLPLYPQMSPSQVDYVIASIKEWSNSTT